MASSSSSGDLFTFKKASAVAVFQRAEPAAPAAEPRAHRRTQGEQAHKRSRAISVDDEEEDEEMQAAAAPQSSPATRRAAPRGHCAPADDDEAAWLPPPPQASRGAVVLTEEESSVLRRNQQALEELQRPVQEEPEARPSAPVAPPQAPSNASKLTIFLQTADGKRTKFKVKSDTRFASVFTAYCESTGRPRSSVAFSFDGDAVQPDATPGDLDMGDEDVVDVKLT